tara:strand:+ start:3829 stop:4050 length:222 start_codon:yes stop_codon:yes gene_type:complete
VRYILHYTDTHPIETGKDGIFIHIEYKFNQYDEPYVACFKICNIINGELGQEIDVNPVLKMSIVMKLIPLMSK